MKNNTTTLKDTHVEDGITVIDCSLFIVPNAARKIDANSDHYSQKSLRKYQELFNVADDVFIQVWLHNQDEDNILDHWYPPVAAVIDDVGYELLHGIFPSSYFIGKKEGDKVVIDIPKAKIRFNCVLKQIGYRYQRFGKFEEALDYVLSFVR